MLPNVIVYPLLVTAVVQLGHAADNDSSATNSSGCSLPPPFNTTNFTACMKAFQDLDNNTCLYVPGLFDNKRNPVQFPSQATAISLHLCRTVCGAVPEPFKWSTFSSQFGAWLLPWLALIPQLPFGSRDRSDNLMSMLLALGSPALGAYSLIFTVLNGHWIARRLSDIRYPNVKYAWRVLSSLQQSALRIDNERGHFSSLVVLPENDNWWKELAHELDYKQTWSLATVAQIAWVLIAFILTVIDSFESTPFGLESNGQGVGSVFLWLLPIVIGYLQLAPKCDDEKVRRALEYVNQTKSYAAGLEIDCQPERVTFGHHGLRIEGRDVGEVYRDEQACAPIYNYSRFLSWTACAEYVATSYSVADQKATLHRSVNGTWKEHCTRCVDVQNVCCLNRTGTHEQVRLYTGGTAKFHGLVATGVFRRFIISSLIALLLLWGTVGGGVIVVLFTPTIGLGCRSGTYILYAAVATIIWHFMVLASFFSHYASPPAVIRWETKRQGSSEDDKTLDDTDAIPLDTFQRIGDVPTEVTASLLPSSERSTARQMSSVKLAASLAIAFRRLGKILAVANSAWIIFVCIMQFSNIFDECYCNASSIGLGSSAYFVINLQPGDVQAMRLVWGYALGLSLGTAVAFVIFVALYVDPPTPEVVRDR